VTETLLDAEAYSEHAGKAGNAMQVAEPGSVPELWLIACSQQAAQLAPLSWRM
jgi:hypothetical protein